MLQVIAIFEPDTIRSKVQLPLMHSENAPARSRLTMVCSNPR
jgi:hypothetical protein